MSTTNSHAHTALLVMDAQVGVVERFANDANLLQRISHAIAAARSVIVTSNLRYQEWTSIFGNDKMTLAFIDRQTHKGQVLEFVGDWFAKLELQRPNSCKAEILAARSSDGFCQIQLGGLVTTLSS